MLQVASGQAKFSVQSTVVVGKTMQFTFTLQYQNTLFLGLSAWLLP